MSPSSREINGPRPAPLKIHKDSHLIHKQSSSSSTTSTTSSSSSTQRHHPVIIYTRSPKIIHTQARDFMALVQKLTGLSHSTESTAASAAAAASNPPPPPSNIPRKDADTVHAAADMSSSSSENCSIAGDVGCSTLPSAAAAALSPLGIDPPPPPNPFLSEIPLFTPNSSDFFCWPRSFSSYPESAVFSPSTPNMGGSISSSIMEATKAFPEY